MRIEGTERIAAPRERVWEALMDPEVLAGVLPGFQRLEKVGENQYDGALALGVGPVQGRFEGSVALEDLDPPRSYRLRLSGRGGPGHIEGEGEVTLSESGSTTDLAYDIDVRVGGRMAAVGQRILGMTAKTLSRQTLQRLSERLASDGTP